MTKKNYIKQPTLTAEQLSCVQNSLSVGIMLACSSEILCRTAAIAPTQTAGGGGQS